MGQPFYRGGSSGRYAQSGQTGYKTGGNRTGSAQGGVSSCTTNRKTFSFPRCGVCNHFHPIDCMVSPEGVSFAGKKGIDGRIAR
jgi:hypothetical protein